ncbi:cyclase family protein [Segniliparus rotundus DSM 44985]|uniref:Cyclase family protein n=1 Tax=Segniliparus rotundus (strain ATCC BAA-972 / CDC 1076 / CIP 108378 / DSM 44985 / JCM 13578) TaxID=640132 RepID=D6ZEG9_SEGRD|nr:cyclase family protein [Segniliparus rotundus]ADG99445.1 cyclase family protein [Segniliparus rotundus DSM 44985]
MADGLEILEEYIARCSNWGRWGDDDQAGTINLITEEKVREAAALVRVGKIVSLTMPYDMRGPQNGYLGRSNPVLYQLASGPGYLAGEQTAKETAALAQLSESDGRPCAGYYDDVLVMPTQSGTQWDALCHFFWRGRMYNGRPAAEAGTSGSRSNGVQHYTGRIVTRGVFADLAEHRGVEALEPGDAITADELEECLAAEGVEIRPGDALVVRTGFLGARRGKWADYAGGASPGLSLHTAPWLREKDIAAVATDTWGVEVLPNEIDCWQPLHIVALVHTGLALGEMFDLDALSADCKADRVYEFMFSASPLPLTGASGSPVSALAVK